MAKQPPIRYGRDQVRMLVLFAIQLDPRLKSKVWADILAGMNVSKKGNHWIWIPD
jgi:hypothetical protein